MKKIMTIAILGMVGFGIAGCGEEETKTLDYYMQHDNERETKIKECKSNPGELQMTPNCINAGEASMQKRRQNPDTVNYNY